jgi:integrase
MTTLHSDEDYIFPSQNSSKEPTSTMIRKSFRAALKQLGLNDVVFHSLRHRAASHLAMSGALRVSLWRFLVIARQL